MRYRRPLIQGLCAAVGQRLLNATSLEPRTVFKDPARRELSAAVVDPDSCVVDYRRALGRARA
jgi:hypothetical protein